MSTIINKEQISEYIPHRFENLILDQVEKFESGESEYAGILTLKVSDNDSEGRNLFLRSLSSTQKVFINPPLAEFMAIGSVVAKGGISDSEVLFFAALSNVEFLGHAKSNSVITAKVKDAASKHNFKKFSGEIFDDSGELIFTGSIMAFIVNKSEFKEKEEIANAVIPVRNVDYKIIKNTNLKDSSMFAIDSIKYINDDLTECCSSYVYPESHPLVKGHFPGNPVMMGVMLWMLVEDAIYGLSQYRKDFIPNNGTYIVECSAEIINRNKVSVAEIKGVKLRLYKGVKGIIDQVEVISAKKVLFKSIVKPNDTLYCHAKNITVEFE